ncbi:hypothetical protein Tco_0649309, partial [Tanacetum coccineum]
ARVSVEVRRPPESSAAISVSADAATSVDGPDDDIRKRKREEDDASTNSKLVKTENNGFSVDCPSTAPSMDIHV